MSEPTTPDTPELKIPEIAGYYRLRDAVASGAYASPSSDYLRYSALRGKIICIEGIISAGKTTLGCAMAEYLNQIGLRAEFFQESVDENLLHMFYSDPGKYAFAFQAYMLRSCIANLEKAAAKAKESGTICIIDRSTWGNAVFAVLQKEQKNISEAEWAAYLSILRGGETFRADCVLYLDRHPAACHETIAVRGRESEAAVALAYLQDLERYYTTTLVLHIERGTSNVIIVDWAHFGRAQQALDAVLAHTRPYRITGSTLPVFTKDRTFRARVISELIHKGEYNFGP